MCQRKFIALAIRFYLFGFTASWVFGETEEEAQKWLDELEPNYSKICNQFQLADWNAATNITEETVKVQVREHFKESLNFKKVVFYYFQTFAQNNIFVD